MEHSEIRDFRPPRIPLRSMRATGASPRHHRHLPHPLPCRLHRDAHILAERGQELEQPADLNIAGAARAQRRTSLRHARAKARSASSRLMTRASMMGLRIGRLT